MPETDAKRILVIHDDENESRQIAEEIFMGSGHSVLMHPLQDAGLNELKEDGFDLVLARLYPQKECNVVGEVKKRDPDSVIIGLIDTPKDRDFSSVTDSLGGVYDFLERPIQRERLHLLIAKGIQFHAYLTEQRKLLSGYQERIISLQKQNTLLSRRIEESAKNMTRLYENLRNTYMHTIKVLAQAIDARDHYTHSHSENVARYATAIAEEMHMSVREIDMLRDACELHDLGKIGVIDSILSKPSGLTQEEWKQIRKHPVIGAQILEPLTFLGEVIDLVRQHHERYDGTGYPQGLRDGDILLGARILHLADAYESMVSARSYRKIPLTQQAAIEEIKANKGTQFDPAVVDAFLKIADKL